MTFDPEAELLLAHWRRLCAGRPAPNRNELNPARLAGLRGRFLIAERIGPGAGRIRVAGPLFNGLLGMEVRGMPLSALIVPEDRAAFASALERAFEGGGDTRLRLRPEAGEDAPDPGGQMLLLPLTNDRNGAAAVLGCLALSGPAHRAPHRFRLLSVTHRAFPDRHRRPVRPGTAPTPLALQAAGCARPAR